MCFSASASFAAATGLLVASIFAMKKVRSRSQFAFASIPLLFSIQQFAEGFVWLSLTHENFRSWEAVASYSFLFFAQVVWPLLVPFSLLLIEKNAIRRKALLFFTYMGSTLGAYLFYCLLTYPINAKVVSWHIHYTLDFPLSLVWISGLFYFIPTVASPLISSVNRIPQLGIAIFISYIFTRIYYENYFISVWCFFAAIISVLVLSIVVEMNKPLKNSTLLFNTINEL